MRLLLIASMLLVISCSDANEPTLCEEYCDAWSEAYLNEIEPLECSISDEAELGFESRCERACGNAYLSAEDRYHDNIDQCLECLVFNTDGDQIPMTFNDLMWGGCQSACSGTTQFFASFFAIPPKCE